MFQIIFSKSDCSCSKQSFIFDYPYCYKFLFIHSRIHVSMNFKEVVSFLKKVSSPHILFCASRQFLIFSFALRANSSYSLWRFAPIPHILFCASRKFLILSLALRANSSHFHGASRLSSSFFPIFLTLPNPIFNCLRHHALLPFLP